HTGEAGNNPAFPAQWLYGLCRALPGDEFLFVSVISELTAHRARSGRWGLRRLGCSNDSQDHTVLPYAGLPPSRRLRRDKPAESPTKMKSAPLVTRREALTGFGSILCPPCTSRPAPTLPASTAT